MEETKQYDDDIKIGQNGKHYSKDSLVKGIQRFSEFKEGSAGGDYCGDLNTAPLDPATFTKNPNGWDLRKACEWLHQVAKSSSQHICATYVRAAIDVGFHTDPGKVTNTQFGKPSYTGSQGQSTDRFNKQRRGRPGWAWEYISYLPTIGFKCIGKVSKNSNFTPEPGDIAVYQKGSNPNVPGHICMWTGAEWASDFKQRNMIVYQSTPEAYIFRFT